ncbi:MAG: S8 family peptidase [Pirellulaceae bacterium]|nr:S8 family peptidase [Pirellulaceae bacterium]
MMSKTKTLIPTLILLLTMPCAARSADKSVIIRFKQSPGPTERTLIRKARGKISRSHQLIPAMTASLPEEEIAKLRKNSRIAYIEDNVVYAVAPEPPADNEVGNSWGVAHIFADVAHASGNRGAGIKVAILDTGIDYTHEDLAGNYIGGYDFVFNDNDPYDDSYFGHGTHVAGIVAAEENGIGVIGVAPEAELLAVKVLDGGGFGTADRIIAGIEWAVLQGADVINLSIQGGHSQGLRDACDAAYEAGVLIVAAGGNSLAGGGPVRYPAAYDSVIAVTATDTADVPGYFAPVGNALELTAPGVEILSTVARGGYDYLSGTSQAAPHVTGAAALYMASNTKDVNGDGTVDHRDVRQLLQSTATDLGAAGKDAVFGYGLVNARGAAFTAEDDDGDGQCGGWISQLVSYVVDHLFSRLVPVEPSPETQKWLKSTQTALSRFLDSVWTWKTSGPRSAASMFGKR